MGLVLGNEAHVAHFVRMRIDSEEFGELKKYLVRFQSELAFLIRAFFFVFLGLMLNPSPATLAFSLTYGLLFTGFNLGLRYVSVVLATVRSPMAADRAPMTLLCGQGLAHATLAVLPLQLGIVNAATYPLIVVMIILATNVITAVASVSTARRRPRETRAPVPHSEE